MPRTFPGPDRPPGARPPGRRKDRRLAGQASGRLAATRRSTSAVYGAGTAAAPYGTSRNWRGSKPSGASLPTRAGLLQRRFGADTLSLPVRAKEGSFLILPCSRPKHLGNPPGQPLGEGTAAADGASDASGVAKKLSTPGPAPSDFTRWRTRLCSRLETPRPHGTSEGDKAKSLATNYWDPSLAAAGQCVCPPGEEGRTASASRRHSNRKWCYGDSKTSGVETSSW